MCFHSKQSKSAQELENRFKARFADPYRYIPGRYNGFQHPQTPVITHNHPNTIQMIQWGLIPAWSADDSIKKHTLNARIETLHEKPAFRDVINNRCLVLADGFFEWQWLDAKGKAKQPYLLTLPGEEAFGFAGIWSVWTDRNTGEQIQSYTLLTTEANELMSRVHNTQKRMPILIAADKENAWLNTGELVMQNNRLVATAI